jgi:D-alanyl-D-alanine carboxypeptidase
VVLGGRSGGSRDAIMRNLLAENLDKGATTRTAAAITERNSADANIDVAEIAPAPRPAETAQVSGGFVASEPSLAAATTRPAALAKPSLMAAAAAALPPAPAKPEPSRFEPQAKPEPAPLTSGVIQTQAISAIPGSAEPMKPVKVRTVQVKAGPMKLASAGPPQPAPAITNAIPPGRPEVAETSSAVVAKAETKPDMTRPEATRAELPPQPANFGTGHGVLGVLPASSVPAPAVSQASSSQASSQALAYAQPQAVQQSAAIKPAAAAAASHSGWIIQVGALESEGEARARIDLARNQARGLLSKADPFTEPVVARDNRKLFRARFAGLERDQAEAVCKTLKRADISCITVRN